MRLTKKQAGEYITDCRNWRLVQDGEYVKVYRLDFGDKHYVDIHHRKIINTIERLMHKEEPKIGFEHHDYHYYEPESDSLGYQIRATAMVDEIWNEAKKIV